MAPTARRFCGGLPLLPTMEVVLPGCGCMSESAVCNVQVCVCQSKGNECMRFACLRQLELEPCCLKRDTLRVCSFTCTTFTSNDSPFYFFLCLFMNIATLLDTRLHGGVCRVQRLPLIS